MENYQDEMRRGYVFLGIWKYIMEIYHFKNVNVKLKHYFMFYLNNILLLRVDSTLKVFARHIHSFIMALIHLEFIFEMRKDYVILAIWKFIKLQYIILRV